MAKKNVKSVRISVKCGSPTAPGLDGKDDAIVCFSVKFPDSAHIEVCVDVIAQGNKEDGADGDNTPDIMDKLAKALGEKKKSGELSEANAAKIKVQKKNVEKSGGRTGTTVDYLGRIVVEDAEYVDAGTDNGKIMVQAGSEGGYTLKKPKRKRARKQPKGGWPRKDEDEGWTDVPFILRDMSNRPLGIIALWTDDVDEESGMSPSPPILVAFTYVDGDPALQSREIRGRLIAAGIAYRPDGDWIVPTHEVSTGLEVRRISIIPAIDPRDVYGPFPYSVQIGTEESAAARRPPVGVQPPTMATPRFTLPAAASQFVAPVPVVAAQFRRSEVSIPALRPAQVAPSVPLPEFRTLVSEESIRDMASAPARAPAVALPPPALRMGVVESSRGAVPSKMSVRAYAQDSPQPVAAPASTPHCPNCSPAAPGRPLSEQP